MSMNKIANVKLETTANYQDLSKLGVSFWNQDMNTAILQFQITRNNYPLSLSKENVQVFVDLESGDSFLVDDNLEYSDELNGVVEYTIPTDFMRVAKNVVGQVYVTTLDQEETIVQRKFTFDVANDLISSLPSEDKIREIKYFSDMRAEVALIMEKLNNDFSNMNDYVTQVEQTTQDGITALTNLINAKQDAYNVNHTAKLKELNDKGIEYSTKFDSDKDYIDEQYQAFRESVNDSGLVTIGESDNWQKYKLTNDNGSRVSQGELDLLELEPGYYETWKPKNGPIEGDIGFFEVDVTKGNSDRKRIVATQSYGNRTFINSIHTNGEVKGWKEVALIDSTNPFETLNGSQGKANTAENNAKQYTDEKFSNQHAVLFQGSANGVGTKISLTDDYTNYSVIFISGDYPGGEFTESHLVANSRSININKTNLIDNSSGGVFYELLLRKTDNKTLTIGLDHFQDISNSESTGNNKFTVERIEGWK